MWGSFLIPRRVFPPILICEVKLGVRMSMNLFTSCANEKVYHFSA